MSANVAEVFFDALGKSSFKFALASFAKGVGVGFDGMGCEFPQDLDPCEEVFVGVRFYVGSDVQVISQAEFRNLLAMACKSFISKYPDEKGIVCPLLVDALARP